MGKSSELPKRVSKLLKKQKEHIEAPTAVHHVRALMATLCEAVTRGELDDIRSELSHDYR